LSLRVSSDSEPDDGYKNKEDTQHMKHSQPLSLVYNSRNYGTLFTLHATICKACNNM
jgi:hypothetical protein